MKKPNSNDVLGTKENVSVLHRIGNGDTFCLLCKESSEQGDWMKSTKAIQIDGVGCVLQVTTQMRNPDGSYAISEALTFVPGVMIVQDTNLGRKLVAIPDPLKLRKE